jgi:hypothetical protein
MTTTHPAPERWTTYPTLARCSGRGRGGTLWAKFATVVDAFGEPDHWDSDDDKIGAGWYRLDPEGRPFHVYMYWWNGEYEWSINAAPRTLAHLRRLLGPSVRADFPTVTGHGIHLELVQ